MNTEWLFGILLIARAVLFGFFTGVYYELFRFLRVLFIHSAWLVAIEDLLFFLPVSLAHVFFHYAAGGGETRWFGVLGVVLGFLLYLASVGKIVQRITNKIRRIIQNRVFHPLCKRFKKWKEIHSSGKDKKKEKKRGRHDKI